MLRSCKLCFNFRLQGSIVRVGVPLIGHAFRVLADLAARCSPEPCDLRATMPGPAWAFAVAFGPSAIRLVVAAPWPSDPPAYPRFPGREVQVLNGTWDFAFLGDIPLVPQVPQVQAWEAVSVPDAFDLRPDKPDCQTCWGTDETRCSHCCSRAFGQQGDTACWRQEPTLSFSRCCGQNRLRLNRGVAAYRAKVVTAPGVAALLHLAGCTLRCLVAVDGTFLADHAGLSPFWVSVPAAQAGLSVRSILVLADNRFDTRTHPVHQRHYDWYQAGGLVRAVTFHALKTPEPVYLESVEVYPRSLRFVDVKIRVSPAAEARRHLLSYRWRFDDDGRDGDEDTASRSCHVWAGWNELEPEHGLQQVEVPLARPWSPASPNLHRFKVAVLEARPDGVVLDCVEVRFGLRVVETRGREILLNGDPVKLFGLNRHDMTDTPVLSYGDSVRDIAVLETVGANFVRGAHYAQDQRFLDLCDVHGILVWEEVLGWQNTPEDFADGVFMSQNLRMADEMAAASANHPSVIFFGFFNEGASNDDGPATTEAYRAMASRLRERSSGSRLISWGSSAAAMDRQLDFADVCAFHAYPAWYPTPRPVNMQEVQDIPMIWEAYAGWVESMYPDKPLLVTEAGAGGLYRHHGPSDVKWTEEYQSLLMQMHFLAVMQNARIVGIALWQFADIPIDRNVSSEAHRPRGLNNKGIVGLDRLPKVAFHALRLLRKQRPGQFFGLILPEADAARLSGVLKI